MNKLELAQQYMVLVFSEAIQDFENIELHIKHLPRICFDMAEAMLAENEKRQDKSQPEVLEEWQPDWSQAPDWADKWEINDYISGFMQAWWLDKNNEKAEAAPLFDYNGSSWNSLRKRP